MILGISEVLNDSHLLLGWRTELPMGQFVWLKPNFAGVFLENTCLKGDEGKSLLFNCLHLFCHIDEC